MRYVMTFHAAMRYKHRIRPDLSVRAAGRALQERMEAAPVTSEPPAWIVGDEPADRWVFLDDETVVVVQEDRAITVLTRAMADDLVRRQCERLGWIRGSREPATA